MSLRYTKLSKEEAPTRGIACRGTRFIAVIQTNFSAGDIYAKKKPRRAKLRVEALDWSGQRESNPPPQLGKLLFYR